MSIIFPRRSTVIGSEAICMKVEYLGGAQEEIGHSQSIMVMEGTKRINKLKGFFIENVLPHGVHGNLLSCELVI